MINLKTLESFIFETDGYGRDFFIRRKDGKVLKYFFKIEGEEEILCFIINIGKNSRKLLIESPENSYCVISVEPINQNVMEDFLINNTDYKSRIDDQFELTNSEILKFYKILSEAIKDYLANNPKVSYIYDEILLNLKLDVEDYIDKVESLISMWSYNKWSIQKTNDRRVILYIRRDHE